MGVMAYTVNYVDVATYWQEPVAQLDKTDAGTIESLRVIARRLPWPLRGLHPDSGSEFINRAGIAWCKHRRIELTRSRPSKKNDNCYVEQRNLVVVRKYVGYERYDCVDAVIAMNELYETLLLYLNFFQPTFKLQGKAKRVDCDNKQYTKPYRRVYDKPKTPNRRVLVKT
jgi:transposase InsO family protein